MFFNLTMPEATEFYITLLSNDSASKFNRNTLSRFTNYLDTPLCLQPQEWQVGLAEIFYNPFVPDHFDNFQASTEKQAPEEYANCETHEEIDGTTRESCFRNGGPPKMDFMFIYCDIIEPRAIGSQKNKLLKIVPAPSYPEQTIRFGHIEYIGLKDDYIRTISIKITNQMGKKISFVNSYLPTMVTLHFKKMIYKR